MEEKFKTIIVVRSFVGSNFSGTRLYWQEVVRPFNYQTKLIGKQFEVSVSRDFPYANKIQSPLKTTVYKIFKF